MPTGKQGTMRMKKTQDQQLLNADLPQDSPESKKFEDSKVLEEKREVQKPQKIEVIDLSDEPRSQTEQSAGKTANSLKGYHQRRQVITESKANAWFSEQKDPSQSKIQEIPRSKKKRARQAQQPPLEEYLKQEAVHLQTQEAEMVNSEQPSELVEAQKLQSEKMSPSKLMRECQKSQQSQGSYQLQQDNVAISHLVRINNELKRDFEIYKLQMEQKQRELEAIIYNQQLQIEFFREKNTDQESLLEREFNQFLEQKETQQKGKTDDSLDGSCQEIGDEGRPDVDDFINSKEEQMGQEQSQSQLYYYSQEEKINHNESSNFDSARKKLNSEPFDVLVSQRLFQEASSSHQNNEQSLEEAKIYYQNQAEDTDTEKDSSTNKFGMIRQSLEPPNRDSEVPSSKGFDMHPKLTSTNLTGADIGEDEISETKPF